MLRDFDPRNLNLFNVIRHDSSLLNLTVYLLSVFIFYAWVYFERHAESAAKSLLLEKKLIDVSSKNQVQQKVLLAEENLSKISIKTGAKTILVSLDEVVCFQANGPYVKVITNDKSYLMNTSMAALQETLPGSFIRVHRSNLVNIAFVKQTKSLLNGDYSLLMHNGLQIRASRTYREKLRSALGKL